MFGRIDSDAELCGVIANTSALHEHFPWLRTYVHRLINHASRRNIGGGLATVGGGGASELPTARIEFDENNDYTLTAKRP